MAQPSQFVLKYTDSLQVKKGDTYSGSLFSAGTVLKMKTENVNVSINDGIAFKTSFDDEAYVDVTATYKFDRDCVLAIGIMTEVVV